MALWFSLWGWVSLYVTTVWFSSHRRDHTSSTVWKCLSKLTGSSAFRGPTIPALRLLRALSQDKYSTPARHLWPGSEYENSDFAIPTFAQSSAEGNPEHPITESETTTFGHAANMDTLASQVSIISASSMVA